MTTCNIQNFTNVTGTTKTIDFLAPNTLYSYNFTPVNSAGSLNLPGSTKLFSATLANITALNSDNITAKSARILWNSTASKFNIAYDNQNYTLLFGRNSNYTVPNLTANTTYTVSLYPINQTNLIYNTPTTISITTLPTIGDAIYSSYTDTSVLISWDSASSNMYSTVSILNGDSSNIGITNSYYNLEYLLPNTTYSSIVIYCFNNQGVENPQLRQYLDPITTLAVLNNYYIDNVLSSNITVNWGGSNTTVGIEAKENNVATFNQSNISGSNFKITSGLDPNLDYEINIIPYNSAGVSNEAYRQFQSITTLARAPYLSNVFKSDTELEFYLTGGTYTCNIISWLNQAISFNTSNVFISNLAPNTNFTFNIYPINSKDVVNYTEYTSCNINTKSRVILSPITNLTDSSFIINWLPDSYDYLLASWNSSNSGIIYNGVNYFTASNLSANTYYNINLTTYGIDGEGLTAKTSSFTLAKVATNSVITSSNITLYNTGFYNYNNITLSDSFNNTFNCNLYPVIEYVSPQLISNRLYTVTVNPYNNCNVINTPGTNILYLTTLATVGVSSSYNVLSQTLSQTWQTGTYSYVSLSWNTSNIYNINSNLYNLTGLTPNTYYNFTVTPYNTAGDPNTSEISENQLLTLSYIDSVNYTNTTPYSSTANWYSANGYNSVVILYNLTNDANVIATSNIIDSSISYDLNGLSPNKSYTFTIIPYNFNNIANIVEENVSQIVTLGIIDQVNYINKSQSNIDFSWSGIYSSVNINWSYVATLQGIEVNSSLLLSQNLLPVLQPNTSYKIDVIPCNSNLVPGTSNSISAVTYASLTQLSFTSNESSIYLVYNNTNTYSGGRIFFNDTFITNFIANAYNFQNLITGTTYKIELIPYNTDIDLPNGGYSYINNITTLGDYQYSTYNFINNTSASYNALSLSSLLALPTYNISWASNNISYYTSPGYIQLTLPVSGFYNIIIAGAAGGCNTNALNVNGFGAVLSARFYVNIASEKLILIPGLMGSSTSGLSSGAGGGGASSLFRYNYTLGTISPLMVAGGGGGMSYSSFGNNAASGFVVESVPSTNVGNSVDQTAGCATQNFISGSSTYAQPTFSSSGTLYTANGANINTPGGFGGGGAGSTDGTGGGGGSWTGSLNSLYQSGGYGGNRNMIITSALNSSFNGYNTGTGYITITRGLYPIVNVATNPVTNISWGIATINWGSYDSSVDKIIVSWTGDSSSNSGPINSGQSYIVRNLIYPATYTFTITPYDKYNNVGTPLIGTSANSSVANITATSVIIPPIGQLTASATAITNLTNNSFTINWVSIPVSSSITYSYVTWLGNTSAKITNNIRTYAMTGLANNTQYTVTVTPYNIYDIPGAPLIFTVNTLPLAFVAFTPITNNSSNTFRINWNNGGATPYYNTLNMSVYSNVLVYNETGINNTTSFRTINNLLPNMVYNVYLDALASDGLTYTSISTSNITHAYIAPPLSITNIIDKGYSLSWAPKGVPETYSSITVIVRNGITTVFTASNLTGTSLNITGLAPFTNYNNLVYPVNSSNISTNYNISSNITTLPGITSIYTSDLSTTGMTVNWTGNYSRLDLTRSGGSTITNIQGTSSIYTGLIVNTGYTFTFAPYDNLNNLGTSCNVLLYTLPAPITVSGLPSTASTTSVFLRWSIGSRAYINITWTGGSTGSMNSLGGGVTTRTISGLVPNSVYYFTITPYNLNNVAGVSLNISLTTYAFISLASNIPSIYSSDIYYYGTFDSTIINILSINYTNNTNTIIPLQISNLSANSSYSTDIYGVGILGIGPVTTTIINTLGYASVPTYSFISSNLVSLNWSGQYTKIDLSWYGTSSSTSNNLSKSTSNLTINNLIYNGIYTFSLLHYNTVSAVGALQSSSVYLLPYIALPTYTASSNLVNLSWLYGACNHYINWSGDIYGEQSNISASNYTINNLTPSQQYNINILPFNAISQSANQQNISLYTLPYVSNPTFSAITESSINVSWSGIYSNVDLYWSTSNLSASASNLTPNITSSNLTGLYTSSNYTFTIVPFNGNNERGLVTTSDVYTLPYVFNLSTSAPSSRSIQITWSGTYEYVNLSWIENRFQTGSGSVNNYNLNTYTINDTRSSSRYDITLTPYNLGNIAGNSITAFRFSQF